MSTVHVHGAGSQGSLPAQYTVGTLIDWNLIPDYMREGMHRWIQYGKLPGEFLTAVLSNDFMEAVGRADHNNIRCLPNYAMFLYQFAPSDCFGSQEKVREWAILGGIDGIMKQTHPQGEDDVMKQGEHNVESNTGGSF